MEISGYVVLGIVTLFFLYLMPQLIRSRQEVADARVDDRFSADLRILATAGKAGSSPTRPALDDGAPRAYLHDPRLRTGVASMNRPPALAGRTPAAPAAPPQARPRDADRAAAARAEAKRRRRAAARRRLALTLVLLAMTAGAWTAVALEFAQPAGAAVPSVLLVLVLVLGRRAARANKRIERAEAQLAAREEAATTSATSGPGPRGTRRPEVEQPRVAAAPAPAAEPSTEIIPRVERAATPAGLRWRGEPSEVEAVEVAEESIVSTARAGAGQAVPDGSWTPVPVPAPTYTLKPPAPRVDAPPLVVEQPVAQEAASVGAGLDLDAVLNRRRAAGE